MITNVLCTGHRYGTTLVPMSEDDKLNMKYKAEKCLKALGFTDAQNVRTVTNTRGQFKLCIMSLFHNSKRFGHNLIFVFL